MTSSSPPWLQAQASLQRLTSLRVGGVAQWLALPRCQSDLVAALDWARERHLSVTALGAGSNLLISDQGVPGLVVGMRRWRLCQIDGASGQVRVSSGEPLPTLAWKAAKLGCRGLEWAVGIPGTVGGGVVMNAGAHGGCMADGLVSATVLDPDGSLHSLTPADLAFA